MNTCALSRSLCHRKQLFDCQLAVLVPGATWKASADLPSYDEYRSSALGSSLVVFISVPQKLLPEARWSHWPSAHLKVDILMCFHFSSELGKHVFDPAVSKFILPSGISARSILLRFWVLEPIFWHFCFLCTQLHGLPSLASRLTSGLLVCRLYCSKQRALMVCWPQGRRMGNATWSRCRLPLQQTS